MNRNRQDPLRLFLGGDRWYQSCRIIRLTCVQAKSNAELPHVVLEDAKDQSFCFSGREQTIPEVVAETAVMAAPARGRARVISPKPQVEVVEDQVGSQTPDQQHWDLIILDHMGQPSAVSASTVGAQIASEVNLMTTDQQCSKRFQEMKPPQYQGGKSEDAHEFLTLYHEMLETVGMVNACGVHFVALQLHNPRESCFLSPLHSLEREGGESTKISKHAMTISVVCPLSSRGKGSQRGGHGCHYPGIPPRCNMVYRYPKDSIQDT
ncbi:hypothetical protein KY285_026299 [Solanum tuberosum]|nr:hypothetical protein KY285_026299 [Solanum tuberosum]